MPNQVTAAQHYVPQFYLRQWTDASGGFFPIRIDAKMPPRFTVFAKQTGPPGFCQERFFYAEHTGVEDAVSQQIETMFADVEGKIAANLPALERVLLDNRQITDQVKGCLAEFMVFMWLKGKQHRQHSQQLTDSVYKQLLRFAVRDADAFPSLRALMEERRLSKDDLARLVEGEGYRIDVGNTQHLALFSDMPKFCNLLFNKYWTVYISRQGHFITTDAPYIDMPTSSTYWGNDFLSRIQSFVLSPRIAIVATRPNWGATKTVRRKDITHRADSITRLNCYSLMNAIRFGFHSSREHLEELSRSMSKIYPEFGTGDVRTP